MGKVGIAVCSILLTFIATCFFVLYLVNGPVRSTREEGMYKSGVEDGIKGFFKIVPRIYFFHNDSLDYAIVPIEEE